VKIRNKAKKKEVVDKKDMSEMETTQKKEIVEEKEVVEDDQKLSFDPRLWTMLLDLENMEYTPIRANYDEKPIYRKSSPKKSKVSSSERYPLSKNHADNHLSPNSGNITPKEKAPPRRTTSIPREKKKKKLSRSSSSRARKQRRSMSWNNKTSERKSLVLSPKTVSIKELPEIEKESN